MSEWQIFPSGVESVLGTVQEQQPAIAESVAIEILESVMSNMDVASEATAPAIAAVQTLLEDVTTSASRISSRVGAGVLGVYEATMAYSTGQQEMAGEFEAHIGAAAEGDISFFEQHGSVEVAGA
ncbi:DUF6507 family protein [Kocuria sp.]|uniref:DUF6507 family protein n=1 Tax=Kocuria sp. TaxID=1871328 RepID=UPI0026E01978|nr:DUF6507 family protein [Kocuria sp.]MDO5619466.1 DUF6507 family protein [Kocuria sp.]